MAAIRILARHRWLGAITMSIALAAASPVRAAVVLINNGSAPPDPQNVLDDAMHTADDVFVRNAGCPLSPLTCVSPGAATTVHLVAGADVQSIEVRDASHAEILAGAELGSANVRGSATLAQSGGAIGGIVSVSVSGSFSIEGGDVGGQVQVLNLGHVEIDGGSIGGLSLGFGSSSVLRSGLIDGNVVTQSQLEMSGGTVAGQVLAQSSSHVLLTGGLVQGAFSATASTLELLGGTLAQNLSVLSGSALLDGVALMGNLFPSDFSDVEIRAGSVGGALLAFGAARVLWLGGSIGGPLDLLGTSVVEISGTAFEVDGSPVAYGDLDAMSGTLTGTLALGDPIEVAFRQGGHVEGGSTYSGTVRLIPPPGVPALPAVAAGLLALGLAAAGRKARRG